MRQFNVAGPTLTAIGEATTPIGLGFTTVALWSIPYKMFDELRFAPSYINREGQPYYEESNSFDERY